MGDRTYLQAWIYACPDDAEQIDAVLDALNEYDLGTYGNATRLLNPAPTPPDTLVVGAQYTAEEVYVGSADALADRLITNAPDVAFHLWEDPKYEWLGSLWIYTPELGPFNSECDSDGDPKFDSDRLLEEFRAGTLTEAMLGAPWKAAVVDFDKAIEKPYTEFKHS